jgi:lambda repressor-like predicted transcriptional regulator
VHKEDIKAQLRKNGSSLAHVARELEVSKATVSMTLSGDRSERIERAIAAALGLAVEVVFPDRDYSPDRAYARKAA